MPRKTRQQLEYERALADYDAALAATTDPKELIAIHDRKVVFVETHTRTLRRLARLKAQPSSVEPDAPTVADDDSDEEFIEEAKPAPVIPAYSIPTPPLPKLPPHVERRLADPFIATSQKKTELIAELIRREGMEPARAALIADQMLGDNGSTRNLSALTPAEVWDRDAGQGYRPAGPGDDYSSVGNRDGRPWLPIDDAIPAEGETFVQGDNGYEAQSEIKARQQSREAAEYADRSAKLYGN